MLGVCYFQGGKSVWMTPGRLISGVVGNGHGQAGVVGFSVDGSTVGVAIGEFDDDGTGGVFRLVGGGAVDSSTMVVFGSLVGTDVLGCTLAESTGVGIVDDALGLDDALTGLLDSEPVPGLVRFGWLLLFVPVLGAPAGFGAAHFGHAALVSCVSCSIVARASTPDFNDSGGSFGVAPTRAWRALVTKDVIAVIELSSPFCWYDASSLDTPLRACAEKSSRVALIVPTEPPLPASSWTSDKRVIACSRSRRPRESSPTPTLVATFSILRFIPYKVSPGMAC